MVKMPSQTGKEPRMEPQNPSQASVMGNRYKIIATETSGRLAVNYGAFDLLTGRTAGITAVSKRRAKQIGSNYPLKNLRSDAAFCLKVVHPDILHAYDQFDDEDYIYLVSEYSGVPPISSLGPASARPDPASFITAIQKVVYAVEYYHGNQCPGCCIRPQHVRLASTGEVLIDHLLDCRLSFLADATESQARQLLNSRDDALYMDLVAAGEVITLLLREMPQVSIGLGRKETVFQDIVPVLKGIAGRMCKGEFATIQQVSKAIHEVENTMRGELDRIAKAFPPKSHRRQLGAGEVLFREGDPPNGEAFIVERGVIQISKSGGGGRDICLDVSKTGDIVGEMALIDQQPRMATARAIEPSILVVISSAEFRTTLEKMDSVGRRLITVLAGRLRFQAKEVARLKALIGVAR
jgi:CRP/FNR family cyclic AMP-dependent transcriptional regulator